MGQTVAVKLIALEAGRAGAGEAIELTSSTPP